ncbi:hypothetical protein D3C79_821020 [compost metagenome]
MIDNQQVLQAVEGGIDTAASGAAIEIVLQGDEREIVIAFDAFQRSFQRCGCVGQHGQPQAVDFLCHQRQFHGLTTTLEGAGYVAGRLEQCLGAGS